MKKIGKCIALEYFNRNKSPPRSLNLRAIRYKPTAETLHSPAIYSLRFKIRIPRNAMFFQQRYASSVQRDRVGVRLSDQVKTE